MWEAGLVESSKSVHQSIPFMWNELQYTALLVKA